MDADAILADHRDGIRAAVLRLLTNWGKSASKAQLEAWTDNAVEDGHTAADVERGVRRCVREWKGDNAPQGYGNFAQYLPASRVVEAAPPLPWFGNEHDGGWGGDWSGVPVEGWLRVAALFHAGLHLPCVVPMAKASRARAEEFLGHARRRVSQTDIVAAARAHRAGRLEAFVEEWRAASQGGARPQEALGV